MSTTVAEGLFLLACWAPPLAVVAGALLLLTPTWWAIRAASGVHLASAAHR